MQPTTEPCKTNLLFSRVFSKKECRTIMVQLEKKLQTVSEANQKKSVKWCSRLVVFTGECPNNSDIWHNLSLLKSGFPPFLLRGNNQPTTNRLKVPWVVTMQTTWPEPSKNGTQPMPVAFTKPQKTAAKKTWEFGSTTSTYCAETRLWSFRGGRPLGPWPHDPTVESTLEEEDQLENLFSCS